MTTLADKSLLSGGDNKPPMLEKHLYDSWKSIMELYMMNRPNGRMILASVEKGPLDWPSITVDGDSNCDELNFCKVDLMRFIHYGSDALAELKTQVANCTKTNLENKSVNDTLTAELERYKEQVKVLKEGQNGDLRSKDNVSDTCAQSVEIDLLKQTLSEHLKEKESLLQTVTLLKNDFKKEESRNINREIALEKQIKHLDNIKDTPPQLSLRVSWGFRTYNSCFRDEIIPFVQALKDLFSTFNQHLVDELSEVQNVFYQMEQAVEQHRIESKTFEVKMNQVLNENERLLEQVMSKDIVNLLVNSSVDNDSVNVHECQKCLKLETELQTDFVKRETYDKLFKRNFSKENFVSNQSVPSFNQLFELNELKAQSQEKDTEEAAVLKDLVDHIKANYPLDPLLESALKQSTSASGSQPSGNTKKDKIQQTQSRILKNKVEAHPRKVKSSLKNKDHVVEPKGTAPVQHSKLNANSDLKCVKCNGCMLSDNHDLCVLDFINNVNARAKSRSVKKNSKRKVWKPTGKVFTNIGYIWRPTGRTFTIVGNACPLTRITTTTEVPLRKSSALDNKTPKPVVTLVYSRKPRKSKTSVPINNYKVVRIVHWYLDSGCSKHMTGDRSQLTNFVNKFLGTVKFGNKHVAKIMGYGDYQIGNVTISRVYYIEGLGHNLFSVGQFCDSNLEVAFRQHTCYIRNLEGVDLLTGSRGDNLYTLSLGDMMASSPICLLSKASKTKSWLWHWRLSHLNFGAINHFSRHGKSTKKPHKPKSEDTNQEKLYLLHIDLCGPMRVMIQVRLKETVRRIRTDNGTEFVNQTLREYYEKVGISHETSVARSPQQNGVVERRNRTLIEAARTMLIYAKAPLFLWVEAVAITCYTQNCSMIRL
ncbi:retrovirus-related pol polyprotein from transposon TNT 1-94 [Tanacetum coccineum]